MNNAQEKEIFFYIFRGFFETKIIFNQMPNVIHLYYYNIHLMSSSSSSSRMRNIHIGSLDLIVYCPSINRSSHARTSPFSRPPPSGFCNNSYIYIFLIWDVLFLNISSSSSFLLILFFFHMLVCISKLKVTIDICLMLLILFLILSF